MPGPLALLGPILSRIGVGGAASAMGGIVASAGTVLGGAFAMSGGSDEEQEAIPATRKSDKSGGDEDGNAGGSVSPPKIKQAKRVEVNEDMPADKLLKVAVNYLANIDENLKSKIQYDSQLRRSDSAQAREEIIENDAKSDARKVREDGTDEEAVAKKTMNPMLIAIGALGAAIYAAYTAWDNIDWGILGNIDDIASDWFNRGVNTITEGAGAVGDIIGNGIDYITEGPVADRTSEAFQQLKDAIRVVESGGDDNARARTSSATGRYQFIESTWLRLFRRIFPDDTRSREEVLALRSDGDTQEAVMDEYLRENAEGLQNAYQTPDARNLYLAHFLGLPDALRVLRSSESTPLQGLINQDSINSNSFLRGKNVGWILDWAQRKNGFKWC